MDQRPAALLTLATGHATAQQRLDPRFQFGQLEGLGQVIIRAQIQPMNPIAHLAARREHQYRQGLAAPTQARQHLKTIQSRQADIEDRQGVVLAGEGEISGDAIVQHIDRPARRTQGLGHAFREL